MSSPSDWILRLAKDTGVEDPDLERMIRFQDEADKPWWDQADDYEVIE